MQRVTLPSQLQMVSMDSHKPSPPQYSLPVDFLQPLSQTYVQTECCVLLHGSTIHPSGMEEGHIFVVAKVVVRPEKHVVDAKAVVRSELYVRLMHVI